MSRCSEARLGWVEGQPRVGGGWLPISPPDEFAGDMVQTAALHLSFEPWVGGGGPVLCWVMKRNSRKSLCARLNNE